MVGGHNGEYAVTQGPVVFLDPFPLLPRGTCLLELGGTRTRPQGVLGRVAQINHPAVRLVENISTMPSRFLFDEARTAIVKVGNADNLCIVFIRLNGVLDEFQSPPPN